MCYSVSLFLLVSTIAINFLETCGHTGPISLCIDLFVFICVFLFYTACLLYYCDHSGVDLMGLKSNPLDLPSVL